MFRVPPGAEMKARDVKAAGAVGRQKSITQPRRRAHTLTFVKRHLHFLHRVAEPRHSVEAFGLQPCRGKQEVNNLSGFVKMEKQCIYSMNYTIYNINHVG